MNLKVKIIGNSSNWSKDPCTNFVIELPGFGQVLFDAGCGTSKFVQNEGLLDYQKLNSIIITHFHIDHFGDLINIMETVGYLRKNRKVQLIGPKRLVDKLISSYKVFCDEFDDNVEKLRRGLFVAQEVEDGDIVRLGKYEDNSLGGKFVPSKYELQTFAVEHKVPCLGYVIRNTETNECVGFSSDTCDCKNLRKIIKMSNPVFIDTAYLNKNSAHMSLNEVLTLKKEFSDKKFYCVHLREEVAQEISEHYSDVLEVPKANEIIEI